MYSIGEFSKISGLTVKALRFYHEEGVLLPTCVDEATGYRYYDATKLESARLVAQLRKLEFSLDDIRAVLSAGASAVNLSEALERQRAVLAGKARHYRQLQRQIDAFIARQQEISMAESKFQIEEKVLSDLLVAGIRMRGKYSDCGKAFGRLGRSVGRYISGKPLILYYDGEYKDDDADFEPCFPVSSEGSKPGIAIRTLPGGRCLSLKHEGPYETLGESYARLIEYAHQKQYETLLPTREVCWKGPGMIFRGNPQKYLTEIQFLLK